MAPGREGGLTRLVVHIALFDQRKGTKEKGSTFMKKTRVIFSLIVAVAVALVTATSAFAETPPTKGSITLKETETGTTYNLYRILGVELMDTDVNSAGFESMTYTITDKWKPFFTTEGAGAQFLVSTDPSRTLNQVSLDGTPRYLNITEANRVEFANAAMKWALDANTVPERIITGTPERDLTLADVELGYYLMVPLDASIRTGNYATVAALDVMNPDVTLYTKAGQPTLEKRDDTVSATIGDTVRYTVTGKVPDTSGYSSYTYRITDQMTEGLKLNRDVAVKIGTATITAECTIDYDNNDRGFTVTVPVTNHQGDNVGKDIVVTYSAVVTEAAAAQAQATNGVSLSYGHDSSSLKTTTPIVEEVYSSNIVVNKYAGTDPAAASAKLAGATFVLMNSEGKFYSLQNGQVTWHEVADAPGAAETDMVSDSEIASLATAAGLNGNGTRITAKTTNNEGAATFVGLKDGDYYLVEIVAPAGYNRLHTTQKVSVAGTNADTDASGKTENVADASDTFDEHVDAVANVQNNKGNELPTTGGLGTTLFVAIGAVMVVVAATGLIANRRARVA